jgi:hypothetical protein
VRNIVTTIRKEKIIVYSNYFDPAYTILSVRTLRKEKKRKEKLEEMRKKGRRRRRRRNGRIGEGKRRK